MLGDRLKDKGQEGAHYRSIAGQCMLCPRISAAGRQGGNCLKIGAGG
jgi:hypothetical protein